jgi:hypothetical protein
MQPSAGMHIKYMAHSICGNLVRVKSTSLTIRDKYLRGNRNSRVDL